MAKKRRVTQAQAYILSVSLIRLAWQDFEKNYIDCGISYPEFAEAYFGKEGMPEKWFDGETSDQSWEYLKSEVSIQYQNIIQCLVKEAERLVQENPGFGV